MENFIIIVLTSTVISTVISVFISLRMKGNELEVKLKFKKTFNDFSVKKDLKINLILCKIFL